MDLIGELPIEVKDRILECLPTREAARTALLSKDWNCAWLQHRRFVFDSEFFQSVRMLQDDPGITWVDIISNILFRRPGPVDKVTLHIPCAYRMLQQSDFDRWCCFLSRSGVEELNIKLPQYQLPFCLLCCTTIKQLIVQQLFIDLPVNACDIFSNVTSLGFFQVEFKCGDNGIASSISIPKLEKLAFENCVRIDKFEISSPKLEILSAIGSMFYSADSRWLAPHLKAIKTLWLCGLSMSFLRVSMFPTAISLRVLKIYGLSFDSSNQLLGFMELLQKCPNLCELQIMAVEFVGEDDSVLNDAASRLELFIQELQMLKTIKIEAFSDKSTPEMLFMKMLLSKSPALERVIVKSWHMKVSTMRKVQRKLECFPRASPNAQIVCAGNDYAGMNEDWMDTHGVALLGF